MSRLGTLVSNLIARLRGLPTGVQVVGGVVLLAGVAVGSLFMYRTYSYVQHDNDFCLQCHLMSDPYERFAKSAHRGLGCHACHRPNIIQRSEMALTQIVEQPSELTAHAVVTNAVCEECHVRGDPKLWTQVANTAGHRIHLESNNPALRGLQCVKCHSASLHEFTPTNQTCTQAGCHENTRVRLGRMADLTIHCTTCHDFTTPVGPEATTAQLAAGIRPEAQECLACHQMRALLQTFPANDPHNGQCGECHNPHVQATPQQAVQSCAKADCHARPDTITPFHRGLDPGVLEDCIVCHKAHGFRIHDATHDCLQCHADIYRTDAPPQISDAAPAPGRRPVQVASAGPLDPALVRLALAAHAGGQPAAAKAGVADDPPQDTVTFHHAQHRGVQCLACHSVTTRHGALTVTSIQDCRACHHTLPVATTCTRCHSRRSVQAMTTIRVRRRMDLSADGQPVRTLPFQHRVHEGLACTSCHTGGTALSAADVQCTKCHAQHHQPTRTCMSCHPQPPAGAHNNQAHLGCTGAGCHKASAVPPAIASVPRTRNFCLVCHQGMVNHNPGENCEACHVLPPPRKGGGQPPAGDQRTEGK